MPFDLDNLNPSAKFFWQDGEEEWVELRLAAEADNEAMRKQSGIKQKVEYRNEKGQMHRIEFVDADEHKVDRFTALANDFAIVNWCLNSKQGDPIPCTLENKLKMIRNSPQFASWVIACLDKMRDDVSVLEDKETKN